ncbi:hypothetical protein DCS_05296 [Drechmeria coniospora]|uniref:Uncharacterized protein n=1 Tax=Drechmeria coniospora TaxID=98403 RepID=A0A151GME2_DRECN|nr:hypothetical protein DCS_05296 [Drechmeria coniospora]KYK58283.1 hypothetical protein DCS_05296 [Drechmeria coniospora]ODA82880.1 hypothetical protein RJ55_01389 [Drechmeria coniospora]
MAGLIPLALSTNGHSPRYSTFMLDNDRRPPHRLASPPISPKSKPSSRLMQQSTLPTSDALPHSAMEWKVALGEVKRAYLAKKYRWSSDRCRDILNNAKAMETVEPTYLIYLRFYAATALEMQARAARPSSSRLGLLRQAQAHYRIAADLARQADEAMSRPSSRCSLSPVPSYRFSTDSDISRSSTSTRMSSPVPSITSVEDSVKRSSSATKPKKRVTFCDAPITEPIVRPDSPTLGFDDWIGQSSPEPVYPEPILKHVERAPAPMEMMLPSTPDLVQDDDESSDPFFYVRAVHRYCTIISSIRRQVDSHLAMLDQEMAARQLPTPERPASDETRTVDLAARIQRLRANGWRRTRFDAQRYEALCENALADLNE